MKYVLWTTGAIAFVALISIVFRFPKSLYESDKSVEKEIYVSSETTACDGSADSRCLQVRFSSEDKWQAFYGEINGFTHEIGTESKLLVRQEKTDGVNNGDDDKLVWVKTLESKDLGVSPSIEGIDLDLVSLVGEGGETRVTTASITASFKDGAISGSSGCNSYTASYELGSDNSIKISDQIVLTLRACTDTDISGQESQFIQQLPRISEFALDGTRLTLSDDSGETLMVFEKGVE